VGSYLMASTPMPRLTALLGTKFEQTLQPMLTFWCQAVGLDVGTVRKRAWQQQREEELNQGEGFGVKERRSQGAQ
jgi:hypothetical protein